MASASEGNPNRVKLYVLCDKSGAWMDKGTGFVSLEYMEQSDCMGLIVVGEQNDKILLAHKLQQEPIYNRSDESTIITWNDEQLGTDVALSFQDSAGCEHIWAQLKSVQSEVARAQQRMLSAEYQYSDEPVDLPVPDMSNLEEIAKILNGSNARESLSHSMLRPGWISALLDLFKQCEDLESEEQLKHLFRIVRAAIMLNDPQLLEELLKEEFVMDVVGALEYDPELSTAQKHRAFLSDCVRFKEVVPISNATVLNKIHQTYRIQYIKDVILPRSLDDATYATLSSLALFNNVEVVNALAADADFLAKLFVALRTASPADGHWADLVAFLQEFCNLARHLQPEQRSHLFSKLVQLGLFDQVTRIMTVGSDAVKLKASDILLSVMQHDTPALRNFLQKQTDHALFGLLVRELGDGAGESGLAEQVSELFKIIMDPETLKQPVEKDEFLDVFYDKFLPRILDVIPSDKSINPKDGTRHVPATTLALIVDLACFLIQHHAMRVKYFALRSGMLPKVTSVIRRREQWLQCAAVRFLRTCVGGKDDFFLNLLTKNNVFEPIMTAFFQNGDRYNLLNSTTLELIDFICKENIKKLVEHLVTHFSAQWEEIDYVQTFKQLTLKHEQNKDAAQNPPDGQAPGVAADGAAGPMRGRFTFGPNGEPLGMAGGPSGRLLPHRRRRDERGLDRDEEDYFDSDDVDEPASSASGGGQDGGGMVSPVPGQLGSRSRQSPGALTSGRGSEARGPAGSRQPQGDGSPGVWLGLREYDDDEDMNGPGGHPSQGALRAPGSTAAVQDGPAAGIGAGGGAGGGARHVHGGSAGGGETRTPHKRLKSDDDTSVPMEARG